MVLGILSVSRDSAAVTKNASVLPRYVALNPFSTALCGYIYFDSNSK